MCRAMSDTYIQNLFAERIGGRQYGKSTAIYKFEKIKRAFERIETSESAIEELLQLPRAVDVSIARGIRRRFRFGDEILQPEVR